MTRLLFSRRRRAATAQPAPEVAPQAHQRHPREDLRSYQPAHLTVR